MAALLRFVAVCLALATASAWGAGGLGILLLGLWKRRSVGQAVAKVLDLETKKEDA